MTTVENVEPMTTEENIAWSFAYARAKWPNTLRVLTDLSDDGEWYACWLAYAF